MLHMREGMCPVMQLRLGVGVGKGIFKRLGFHSPYSCARPGARRFTDEKGPNFKAKGRGSVCKSWCLRQSLLQEVAIPLLRFPGGSSSSFPLALIRGCQQGDVAGMS